MEESKKDVKEEKYEKIKDVLKGLSIKDAIDCVEYFVRKIKENTTVN